MTRTFVILLVFFFVYGQTNAFIILSKINTFIKWGDMILRTIIEYYNGAQSLLSMDSEKINELLRKLDKISFELKEISNNIGAKLDNMLKTIIKDFRGCRQFKKEEIIRYINTVKRFYNNGIEYTDNNATYNMDTLNTFAHLVLSTSDNLPDTLQKIHELVINEGPEGYLPLLLQDDEKYTFIDCDKNVSAQQNMYNTYITLLITEMKGLYVLAQVYFIKQTLGENHYNYTNELELATDRYKTRIRDYNNVTLRYLSRFPRVIHRCSVNSPERDVHYVELNGFGRASLFREWTLGGCYGDCSRTTQNGPQILPNYNRIHHCENLGGPVTVCPANQGSPREYLWWKSSWSTYGHDEGCENERDMSGTRPMPGMGDTVRYPCNTCVCSMYVNDELSNGTKWYINPHPQFSDIKNNMVVTGLRFIKKGNMISLQIQQNKFLSNGISNNTSQWLDQIEELGYLVYYNRRSIYLDDIILLNNYVVTGVKFKLAENPKGFQLQVHATPFNFSTGELNQFSGGWYSPGDDNTKTLRSYNRKRLEVNMEEADDPARGSDFNYKSGTNEFVNFKHTSIHKDAGQTIIPLIEILPVESQKPFPLSGVGISYKGSHGFGGYIAPRIYTMDIPL